MLNKSMTYPYKYSLFLFLSCLRCQRFFPVFCKQVESYFQLQHMKFLMLNFQNHPLTLTAHQSESVYLQKITLFWGYVTETLEINASHSITKFLVTKRFD